MMRNSRLLAYILILTTASLTTLAVAQISPGWTFGTRPESGEVTGAPGQTIGWGYTMTNLTQDRWLMTMFAEPSGPLTHAQYVDPLVFFEMLAPGESRQVEPADGTGLFRIRWDDDAPLGFQNAGTFSIHAGWYDGDPFNGGNAVDEATPLSVPYTATVGAVPEPSGLCAFGFAGLCLWRRRVSGH